MSKRKSRKKKLTDRQLQQIQRKSAVFAAAIALLIVFIVGLKSCRAEIVAEKKAEERQEIEETRFSDSVMQYQPLVQKYAKENDIEDEEIYLLAIMTVETNGEGEDVMQSSESLGLERNSLGPEESIEQACAYYAQLMQMAKKRGCDHESVIQAYNYGADYLNFVADRGKKNSYELAAGFAGQMSGWQTVKYSHEIAVNRNGGWRYKYGNMFYSEVVHYVLYDEVLYEDADVQ